MKRHSTEEAEQQEEEVLEEKWVRGERWDRQGVGGCRRSGSLNTRPSEIDVEEKKEYAEANYGGLKYRS